MKEPLDHCKAEIARLESWRSWFNPNRKNELAHYRNMLAILQRAEKLCNTIERMKDPVLKRRMGVRV